MTTTAELKNTVSDLKATIESLTVFIHNLKLTEANIISAKVPGKIFCSICFEPTSTDACELHPEAKLITRATALTNCRKSLADHTRQLSELITARDEALLKISELKAAKTAAPKTSRKENPDGEITVSFLDSSFTAKDAHAARVQLRKLGLTVNNARKSGSTWLFDCTKPVKTAEPAADTTPAPEA